MSIDTAPIRSCPSVFDAGLPILTYEHLTDPAEAHRSIARARDRAPIAIGTHGPEILGYDLVHSVLRDPRFRMPNGMFLAGQGITSGPIWDRVTESLISLDGHGTSPSSSAGVEGLHPACDRAAAIDGRRRHHRSC